MKKVIRTLLVIFVATLVLIAGGVGMLLGGVFNTGNPNTHTVNFSFNNRLVSTQTVADGQTATAPYLPATTTDHNNFEYDFVGWTLDGQTVVDPNTAKVTGDVDYAALFKFTGYVSTGAIPNEWVGTYDIPANNQSVSGAYLWQHSDNVYYSYGDKQFVLAADGLTWEPQTWYGLTRFQGNNVWQLGDDVYYSGLTSHYKLADDGATWVKQTWTGLTSFYGESIWQCGDDVYYSTGRNQYKLDAAANNWVPQTWAVNQLSGKEIWQHDGNLYYSFNSNQYKLDTTANDWVEQAWDGLTEFFGSNVWHFGDNVYYSAGNEQYKLAANGETWQPHTWAGELTNFDSKYIWQHNGKVYYAYNSNQYQLAADGQTWQRIIYPATGKLDDFSSSKIWHANGNTYYDGYQFKDGQWVLVAWQLNGLTLDNLAAGIWQVGDAVYYSNDGVQYQLAADGVTWKPQTWTGRLTHFTTDKIWQYDGKVYYSDWSDQYKLDVANNCWELQTWRGYPYFACENVWQHNGEIYYSYDKAHYQLNVAENRWEERTWAGLNSFYGNAVFQIDDTTYTQSNGVLYQLVGDTWQAVPLKQIVLDQTAVGTIGGESFFAYKNVKYVLKDLYYCPEFKVNNYYYNDRSLDLRHD